ncbi:MAG: Sapep family Mn(2+)-dependent dipeptidase [Ruminococcus sp.]|nr:Sapep family Mn(2+)-dependent dipeptidase [Ruminococcus sp.]
MLFGNKILDYKDELLADLNTLLSIESVASEKPEECSKALDFILQRAKDFGLIGEKITEQSAHIQLGNNGKLCGVLSHLDVVPQGNGWTYPAFALTEDNGRFYGRGIADDKGAALVNLYCLRALKDAGIEGANTIRAIYGTSEEVGMDDMDGYFEKMPLPDYAFTPDSDYGICFAEKGILQLEVSTILNNATLLTQFHSGNAINAVPDLAYAILDSSSYDEQTLMRLADASEGNFEFKYSIDGLVIISRGKAAHACEPHKGSNAAAALVDVISNAYESREIGSICSFIDYAINNETNGRSLGLKMSDSVSGNLTVNLSSVDIDDEQTAKARFDIRYPVTVKGESVLSQFKRVAHNSDLKVNVIHHEPPLYVEKDSKLIKALSEAYESVTGEKAVLYSTGGGTYARKLQGKGVAFGPNFKNDDIRMHNSNESVDVNNYFTHAQICLEAMYRLYTDNSL